MIKWTKNSLRKRKEHWVSKEDVETCLELGSRTKISPKHTDQTETWLASYETTRVRFVEDDNGITVIDLYKRV